MISSPSLCSRVLLVISVPPADMGNMEMMVKLVILEKRVFQDVMVLQYVEYLTKDMLQIRMSGG